MNDTVLICAAGNGQGVMREREDAQRCVRAHGEAAGAGGCRRRTWQSGIARRGTQNRQQFPFLTASRRRSSRLRAATTEPKPPLPSSRSSLIWARKGDTRCTTDGGSEPCAAAASATATVSAAAEHWASATPAVDREAR